MSIDACALDMTGAREVYELLNQLDRHINGQDASGRALLYQAKERIRVLMISLDKSNAA
jgi:hypothetical protein